MARLVLQPVSTAFNNNGQIEAGAKRYFYQTGTTTKITIFDAEDEGSTLTNPQIADAYGRFAPAFVAQNRYKVVLTTADDVTLQTVDPVETTAGITGVSSDTAPTLGGDLNTDGNAVFWSKGADVASASELLVLTDGNYFDVTGTTTITSIETTADAFGIGSVIKLHFDAALTLTHHATDLILPGGANITTAAGDEFEFTKYASGDWRCTGYALASGAAITGDVSGPGSSTDNGIPRFDSTTGKVLQTSGVTLDDSDVMYGVAGIRLGGSAAENELADYEEGTFTPIYTTTGTDFDSVSYDVQNAYYTKIGRVVNFQLHLQTSALTPGSASGVVSVGGLPFTSLSATNACPVGQVVNFNGPPRTGTASSNLIVLYEQVTVAVNTSGLDVADMATGAAANIMRMSGQYVV